MNGVAGAWAPQRRTTCAAARYVPHTPTTRAAAPLSPPVRNRTAILSAQHLLLSSRRRCRTSRSTASWIDDEGNTGIDGPLWRDRAGDGV